MGKKILKLGGDWGGISLVDKSIPTSSCWKQNQSKFMLEARCKLPNCEGNLAVITYQGMNSSLSLEPLKRRFVCLSVNIL